MTEIVKPTTGSVCWVELASTDLAAAKRFYGQLFGWNTTDLTTDKPYTMADLGKDRLVAGMMALPAQARAMGAPPHWTAYVAVDDVTAAVTRATSLGGTVLHGPERVEAATFAFLEDPSGGVFAVWEDPTPKHTFVYGEPNAMCWNELISTDVDASGNYYAALFGWTLEPMPMPDMTYILLKNGDSAVGGLMAQPEELAGAPSMWNAYFAVIDLDATLTKATSLGGKVLAPAMEVAGVGRFAVLADPQGAAFSVLQPSVP